MTDGTGRRDAGGRPAVSAVIVSWNVREMLADSLDSLFTMNPGVALEVHVIDNHSGDGSAEMVRERFPNVYLVENSENVGFARANNQAIRQARGRYVLLVNPDTRWVDDSLARMVAFMDSHPGVGAVGPKLLNGDGATEQFREGVRRLPSPWDTLCEYTGANAWLEQRPRRAGRGAHPDHTVSRPADCLSGACLLIRRRALDEVGGFDEGYPFNIEDIDWCHRMARSRWKLHYLAEARLVHFGRQSIMKNRGQAALMAVKGIYRYYGKYHGWGTELLVWALLWPATLAKLAAWILVFLFRPARRESARIQTAALLRILILLPWPAGVSSL